MAKSPEEATASMIANFKKNTGKPLEEWVKIARAAKLAKHGAIVSHLKSQYGIGHGYANMVAKQTLEGDQSAAGGDELVDSQYAGAKAELRPISTALIAAIKKFGSDVEISPKKAYVSLRRNKQFALIQPSTATRVDVGINLKGEPTTDRLEASGSFNAMVSHRVRLEKISDVDKQLLGWLKKAYESA